MFISTNLNFVEGGVGLVEIFRLSKDGALRIHGHNLHKRKTTFRVTKKTFATDLCDSMDPELFTGSISGIIVPETDPTKI